MVKFAIVFISFASVIVAQSQQIQPGSSREDFQVGPGSGGPGEGGPFGGPRSGGPGEGGPFGNGGFNRFSSPPIIIGPGPVIGGNGQPFNGQGFGGNNQNGQNPLNRFPFTDNNNDAGSSSGFRQPGSVIENRNNLPNSNNNNGFPSIAGPGPVVINPLGSTPFPPITAEASNNRVKRAAAASVLPGKKPKSIE
uniref:Uncharacterized protein n=1 Tax=Panagrolaimus davidi TaxID=227884 RepID=A0A914QLY1_9BILA